MSESEEKVPDIVQKEIIGKGQPVSTNKLKELKIKHMKYKIYIYACPSCEQ